MSTSAIASPTTELTQSTALSGPFELLELPYGYDALEPIVDQETMHLHHDVHHRGYVTKLNAAVAALDGAENQDLETILRSASRYPKAVRVNGGGHWNHTFFWNIMTDRKEDQEITPEVLHALENSFTSLEEFKAAFVKAGLEQIGSGWVWLIQPENGEKLELVTTANQDNPLMDLAEKRGTPILGCDLWEHAYYLKHHANREEFLRKFFVVVNWARVQALYTGATKSEASERRPQAETKIH
jgi:Fe-Mn family superoxide dismutase